MKNGNATGNKSACVLPFETCEQVLFSYELLANIESINRVLDVSTFV